MKAVKNLTYLLIIVGAFNWGLVGAFNFDLVAFLFGDMSKISRVVYMLVGLSAILSIVFTLTGKAKNEDDCGCH